MSHMSYNELSLKLNRNLKIVESVELLNDRVTGRIEHVYKPTSPGGRTLQEASTLPDTGTYFRYLVTLS